LAASSAVSSSVLDLGPIGDVLACRRMARRFWPAEASPPTMDLLILAAVCLLVAASVEAPAIDHLSAELRRLGDGDYLAALRSHPSPFVTYAAAELEAIETRPRLSLLRDLRLRLSARQRR